MTTNTKRKILLAVSGMSPQIVTETLYALVTRKDNPWIPDEIHLLSTKEGCERAAMELFHESRNMFGQFCRDYLSEGCTIKFDASCLHPFTRDGQLLPDIRNLEDSAVVADAIAGKVWELTQDDKNTEIHASIAGGRKSMGFLLGYAMSLYGRPQDRLSHVLVTEGFENCKDFYFPPKKSRVIHDKNTKPLDTAHAVIDLAEIPILHLRNKIQAKHLKEKMTFSNLIEQMNLSLRDPSIEMNSIEKTLVCHGVNIPLPPIDFSFYLLMLKGMNESGYFDFDDITLDQFLRIKGSQELIDYLDIDEKNRANRINRKDLEEEKTSHQAIFCDDKKLKLFFEQRRSSIKTILGEKLDMLGKPYLILLSKEHGHHLQINKNAITIIE